MSKIDTAQVTCIADALPASGCSFTDTKCICESKYLLTNVPLCLDANCTVIESLGTQVEKILLAVFSADHFLRNPEIRKSYV